SVVVSVRIDEARRDDQPVRVDGAPGAFRDLADLGDLAVGDGDVGPIARRTGSIDHGAVLDDEVVAHRRILPEKLCPRVHPKNARGACEKHGPASAGPWGPSRQAKMKSDVCRACGSAKPTRVTLDALSNEMVVLAPSDVKVMSSTWVKPQSL